MTEKLIVLLHRIHFAVGDKKTNVVAVRSRLFATPNARLGKIWDVQFTGRSTSISLMSLLLNPARQNQNYSPLAHATINIIGNNKYREYLPFKGNDLSCQRRVKLTLLYPAQLNDQTSVKLQVNECHGRRMSTKYAWNDGQVTIISLRGSSDTGISPKFYLHCRFLPTFNQRASSNR